MVCLEKMPQKSKKLKLKIVDLLMVVVGCCVIFLPCFYHLLFL